MNGLDRHILCRQETARRGKKIEAKKIGSEEEKKKTRSFAFFACFAGLLFF